MCAVCEGEGVTLHFFECGSVGERVYFLLVLNSVTSTPQWIRRPADSHVSSYKGAQGSVTSSLGICE